MKVWEVRILRQSFRAVEEEVTVLLSEVSAAATRFGLGRELRLKLELVLEELFLNTVHYGVDGLADAQVFLSLEPMPDGVRLVYEDDGHPYDPFTAADRTVLDERAADRRVGGLGILLIEGLTRSSRYERVNGCNRIELSFESTPSTS